MKGCTEGFKKQSKNDFYYLLRTMTQGYLRDLHSSRLIGFVALGKSRSSFFIVCSNIAIQYSYSLLRYQSSKCAFLTSRYPYHDFADSLCPFNSVFSLFTVSLNGVLGYVVGTNRQVFFIIQSFNDMENSTYMFRVSFTIT